ncbi:AraC family transcriptional regulator [Desulfofustis glycolicus]|uniref:Transcriptional regulator, AraC family n=1 Tax=Desulfofustis glycolicus DSM 9705 TaxID=1121409 RepID=A0A1M5Y614_9BACT|nr:AraC family transcriptional regulator [Desulfofustis glycolicus]SHI07432.1 transcriptional regulator, AraC family [Desulfofustis glycolicus DSM 9705]
MKEKIVNENIKNALVSLGTSIAKWTDGMERIETLVPGLALFKRYEPTDPMGGMYEPGICIIAQGEKRVLLGNETYVYDADHYLITAVHLPTIAEVTSASKDKPYLGLRLKFDLQDLSQLMADSKLPPPRVQQSPRGIATGKVTLPLLSCFGRLIDLLEEEEDIPVLAPVITREITYRLLTGDQGKRLRQIAAVFSQGRQIAQTIDWIKSNYAEPIRIEDLAKQVNMSISTFHHHFKSITAMTPLQFQKNLRLNEARRLMLAEPTDAATVSFLVGYESPSQFNREYSRLFGAPPLRDIKKLREMPNEGMA